MDSPTSASLENPIAFQSIQSLLLAILNVVMIMAVPIVVFFIIYAGFLYVTAKGNPEQLKLASKALMYAVIGGVIIVGSFAITEIVSSLVESFE
jgi:hypothetical protein